MALGRNTTRPNHRNNQTNPKRKSIPGTEASDPTNFRPISLTSTLGKLFERLLYSRLNKYIEESEALHDEQHGFRKNRSTIDAIYALEQKIEDSKRQDKYLYTAFLDIKKAYDTVWREGLWWTMHS